MMHWGDHNLSGCIRPCTEQEPTDRFVAEVFDTFNRADFLETLSLLEKTIAASAYSLRNLFKDEQRRILNIILDATLTDAEGIYRQIYETNAPLLRFLKDMGTPAPQALSAAGGYVLNSSLNRMFEADELDFDAIRDLVEDTQMAGIDLYATRLEITIRRRMERMAESLSETPGDLALLQQVEALADSLRIFPFDVNLRKVQNLIYDIMLAEYPDYAKRAEMRNETALKWVELFRSIGDNLDILVRSEVGESP
jgi:hypothetical protein